MRNYFEIIAAIMAPLFIIFIIVVIGCTLYDHLGKELETVGIGDTVYILEVQETDYIIIKQGQVKRIVFSDGIKYYIVKLAEFDTVDYRYDYVFKTEKSAIKKVEELQG